MTNGQRILATYFATAEYTHLVSPFVVGTPSDNPEYYPALCGRSIPKQQLRWGTVLENRRTIAFDHGGASAGLPLSVEAIITCPQCRDAYQASE
jgi:hypothetical protein